MEKQPHRESKYSFFQQDTSRIFAQKDSLFYRERLCQYVPTSFSNPMNTDKSYIDELKRILSKLLWPRLVVVRIRRVLAALMPLLNLDNDGTFGILLHDISSVLSPIGWVLHGLRLLINIVYLLQCAIDEVWITKAENVQELQDTRTEKLHRTGVELGNDLIWIRAALATASLEYALVFFLVDILWLAFRAWIAIGRQKPLNGETSKKDENTFYAKLALNLFNVISISALTIMKNFILPTLLPSLALNPVLGLFFALSVLMITILSNQIEQHLERQNKKNDFRLSVV